MSPPPPRIVVFRGTELFTGFIINGKQKEKQKKIVELHYLTVWTLVC